MFANQANERKNLNSAMMNLTQKKDKKGKNNYVIVRIPSITFTHHLHHHLNSKEK